MERPQGQTAAMRLVLRRTVGPVVVSSCRHRVMASARVGELAGVGDFGVAGDLAGGPAVALVVLDGQAELLGAGLEVLVVVAALAGGVLDAAGVGQGVGGLVQDDGQDLGRGEAEGFAADHDFGALVVADVPAAGGVVSPAGLAGFGAAGRDDDHGGDLAVPGADVLPGVFQDLDRAGRLERPGSSVPCRAGGQAVVPVKGRRAVSRS